MFYNKSIFYISIHVFSLLSNQLICCSRVSDKESLLLFSFNSSLSTWFLSVKLICLPVCSFLILSLASKMYRYSVLLLTASLLLLTGTNFTISGAEPLLSSSSSSADALESSGSGAFDASTRDDTSQRFSSAALESADGGGGGRALEVARRSASLQPQWQSASVHRQHQHHQHPHQQQQLPTLELRPVFLSEHFIRQMSPSSSSSSSSSYGTGGGGGQRAPQYFFKPIPRELVPLSGPFLSRGNNTKVFFFIVVSLLSQLFEERQTFSHFSDLTLG